MFFQVVTKVTKGNCCHGHPVTKENKLMTILEHSVNFVIVNTEKEYSK